MPVLRKLGGTDLPSRQCLNTGGVGILLPGIMVVADGTCVNAFDVMQVTSNS
jgi:hypothetical protein